MRRYVQAYAEGTKIARTDPETTKQIIGKYTGDRQQRKTWTRRTTPTPTCLGEQAPYVSAAGMQTLLNFAVNPAGKTAKLEQFIDNSFVAEAGEIYFIEKLYKP